METSWDLVDDSPEFEVGSDSPTEWEAGEDEGLDFEAEQPASAEWSSSEYIETMGGDVGVYAGPYEADALFSGQVFETSGKAMLHDFTVHAINYTEAPNEYGTTVTIGG